jgi:hypothetical protein
MSGYYRRGNRYTHRRYRAKPWNRGGELEEEKQEKSQGVQAEVPKNKDEGVQIDMFEGIPCRLIPMNPEDYPRLLALLNMSEKPS